MSAQAVMARLGAVIVRDKAGEIVAWLSVVETTLAAGCYWQFKRPDDLLPHGYYRTIDAAAAAALAEVKEGAYA